MSDQIGAEKLAQQVDNATETILKYLMQHDFPEDVKEIISTLFEETKVVLEELRVADEELQQQNSELIDARSIIEAERQHYHDLFDAAPVGYIITNKEGVIQEANSEAQNLLNLSQNRLMGKPFIVFVPREYRSTFRNFLLQIDLMGQIKTCETYLQPRETTELRPVKITIAPIKENVESGNLRWMIHDLTGQKRAETAKFDHFFRETFEQAAVGIAHIDASGRWMRVNQKLCHILGYSREELLALMPDEITHDEDKGIVRDILPHLISGKLDNVSLEQRYVVKNGELISVHLTISNVHDEAGGYAYSIAIINDITGSKRILAAEREQRALSEALRETALTLTSTLDFEKVLDHILTSMSRVFAQEAASVLLKDEEGFHIVRGWGYKEQIVPNLEAVFEDLDIPSQKIGIFEYIKTTKEAVIISNCVGQTPLETDSDLDEICSLICVPIIVQDDIIGCLELHSSIPGFFTNYHIEPLQTFAAQAAIAIQNARAHKQAQVLAVHEERQRLARDLHDAVTQTLFTTSLLSEAMVRQAKKSSDQILPSLEELHVLTRGALAEMRSLLMELRPEYLIKTSLSIQLRQLADAIKSRKKVEIRFNFKDEYLPPPDVHVALYRIMQEAFNNIVKHSRADKVVVNLESHPGVVYLDIHDNGRGFNIDQHPTGLGMNTMRERAESVHASLDISSMVGKGTQISIDWSEKDK